MSRSEDFKNVHFNFLYYEIFIGDCNNVDKKSRIPGINQKRDRAHESILCYKKYMRGF